jgi:transcriptional regulator with XRE-family HTH domain
VGRQDQQDLVVLGRAIQAIRRERGVGAESLAAVTGVDRRRLHELESGRLNPRYELLLALAEGLGVPASAFVLRAERLAEQDRAARETNGHD